MDEFIRDLSGLSRQRGQPSVSIYLPVGSVGAAGAVSDVVIRLENALRRARVLLERGGYDVNGFPRSVETNVIESCRHTTAQGLCLLQNPTQTLFYELSSAVPELVVVEDRFHLKPLLGLLDQPEPFHVLLLSLGRVALYEGTIQALSECAAPAGMPKSIDDVIGVASTRRRRLAPAARVNAVSEHRDSEDERRFLRAIERSLRPLLQAPDSRLVVCGEARLRAAYRRHGAYPNAIAVELGPIENPSPARVLAHVRPAVLQRWRSRRRDAIAELSDLARVGRLRNRLSEVVLAADDGRVETLFLARDEHCWGHYDPFRRTLSRDDAQSPFNEDLLDLAAIRTVEQRGNVLMLERGDMPGPTPAAAVLRY